MPLIFVTGTSTSGKSTIAKELLKRGYEAYDTEHNGVSGWYNKMTGERVAGFNEAPERTATWLSQHEWRISIDWVTQIAKKAHGKPVFICGGGADEPEIRPMCDWVIWLGTNEATIRRRVVVPRDHDYGTKPHELAAAIENNKLREAEYRKCGATIVDATQPLDKVVDEILAKVGITYEHIGQSKNSIPVVYDPLYSHAATHIDDTPELKSLVAEVVSKMNLQGQRIATDVDMGRVVGTCDVVTVDAKDKFVYAKRKNREMDGRVPFVKTREPEPCQHVAIQLTPKTDGSYELASAWIGTFGDDEPFPESPQATDKSAEYWNRHAFVWGSQEIIPGTETMVCPW